MEKVICPYCEKPAPLVTGKVLYPHRPDLWKKRFYRCADCDAHVGCHPGSEKALGIPAGQALRKARMRAHAAFDPMWKGRRGRGHRRTAYQWLAMKLGIKRDKCHIGQFTEQQCEQTVKACGEL